jgi:hypothetical protein
MISSQPLGGWNFARFFKSNAVGNVGYPILYLLSKKKKKTGVFIYRPNRARMKLPIPFRIAVNP